VPERSAGEAERREGRLLANRGSERQPVAWSGSPGAQPDRPAARENPSCLSCRQRLEREEGGRSGELGENHEQIWKRFTLYMRWHLPVNTMNFSGTNW
jgi:hypothetical protein